jgi:hypothetical protein
LLTVGENKKPNFTWKPNQVAPLSKDEFEIRYTYKGGIIKKDGEPLPATSNVGIICGYNNVECIDVDLKILDTLKEQQEFWQELLKFFRDNIDDFDNKFVIYKTINNGYHILYRCEKIQGNQKLAKTSKSPEAIIETRGIGGYVFIYENKIGKLDYTEIKEINSAERDLLISICRTFDNPDDKDKEPKVKEYDSLQANEEKPWTAYNRQHSCIDLIDGDFEIIRNNSDRYIIRRFGAESAHSGYIYKSNGCMYLFSTGTIYPAEKLINPALYYTLKFHGGDWQQSSKDLYNKGYGTRIVKEPASVEVPKIDADKLVFPLYIYPDNIQNYIMQSAHTLGLSIDYMGCSMLWLISVVVGNSLSIRVKTGWNEMAVVWLALVGKKGIGKTPSINQMIWPLERINNQEIKKYIKQYAKFKEYDKADKKDKAQMEEITEPKKTQFIVNDVTLEALVDMHEENKNAVGVFKDELAGWFKDMNKYRAGSDLEFWLSSWSGKSVNMNRKTAKSSFVDKPFIPVLGGIQPSIFEQFNNEQNVDNGFIDRLLLTFPDAYIENYNENELQHDLRQWYSDYVVKFYDHIKKYVCNYSPDGDVLPYEANFTPAAKKEWIRVFNNISEQQNSDDMNEYMKSMLPKQKSYIPRFALLINTLDKYDNDDPEFRVIEAESVIKAEALSEYFVTMAKKIKIEKQESDKIRKVVGGEDDKKAAFLRLYKGDKSINKSKTAEILDVSKRTIYNWIKEIDK